MIPPKGIKRGKNIAGTELLDGEEIREWFIGGRRWWKWRCRWLLVALSGNIPIETTSHETVKESNSVIGKTVIMSLVGITDSEDIEKDARFLGELIKVFESFETSTQFTSASQKIETAYQNTRRVLKKRIKNKVCLGNYKCASMGKKFGSCSSEYNVFYISTPPVLFQLLQLLIFKIFSNQPPPHLFPQPRLFGTIKSILTHGLKVQPMQII